MDGSSPPQHLDYAPRPSARLRILRRAGWAVLVVLIAFLFTHIGPVAWRNVRLTYSMRHCMSYRAPADVVVGLWNQKPIPAPEWSEFYKLLSHSGTPTAPTLFMHERVTPAGKRRLVVVEAAPLPHSAGNDPYAALVHIIAPGGLSAPPQEISTTSWQQMARLGEMKGFYPGQPDASDPTHFTIRMVSFAGDILTFDGWLRDDDTVLIEPRLTRPLPATGPAQASGRSEPSPAPAPTAK